jgi:hypothetical protein
MSFVGQHDYVLTVQEKTKNVYAALPVLLVPVAIDVVQPHHNQHLLHTQQKPQQYRQVY